jgi:hypothetical protein
LKAIACRVAIGAPKVCRCWRSRAPARRRLARRRSCRGERDAAAVDQARDVGAGRAAQPGLCGHPHAAQLELHRRQRVQTHVALRCRAQARRVARHQERLRTLLVHGDEEQRAIARDPGHEALEPIEDEGVVVAARRRSRAEGIEAEARLDQRERSGHEVRSGVAGKPRAALLGGAEVRERQRHQRGGEDGQRDREVAPGELLGDQGPRDRAALAAAAVLRGQRVRDEAELKGPRDHVVRQRSGLGAVARARPHLARRELAHGLDDQLLLVAGLEIDHVRPHCVAAAKRR